MKREINEMPAKTFKQAIARWPAASTHDSELLIWFTDRAMITAAIARRIRAPIPEDRTLLLVRGSAVRPKRESAAIT